ncbi:MAG TPA: phosphoribosylformylglycinamidine synthase subunit PurL [Candidatus Dormibacteraeota bacterium]|nr:phosphoribosylformylglycinamidine synthase subunit PurL [Candidatus Dormibacteraeota bacterium]
MSGLVIDEGTLREVALTREEYAEIVRRLGREPNRLELGMLGVLWSEHCSYKSSRPLLRRLPSSGPRVLQGPGENAGVVDIGQGWAVVFKVESHNHPSAVEPYQGAATGVGGILRDVLAMGARPVALLDSLRFGPLPGSRRHLEGVVGGIGGYGNCVGVPTVGGEIYFDEGYAGNPLVNAMCVGLMRADRLRRARAGEAGNLLVLAGSPTGRDGLHGASFASLELDEAWAERRPAVQVGNPFLEKCLLEACLELVDLKGVVGLQDLGAAGLTSAAAEVAARTGVGARIETTWVPRREAGMTPYEVMLSESQERMLVVVEPGCEAQVVQACTKWDLEAKVIGEVTADGDLSVLEAGAEVARLPIELLTGGVPTRQLRPQPPASRRSPPRLPPLPPAEVQAALLRLLRSPNLGSRQPVFRRYDHMVGNATVLPPGGDAAVLRVLGTSLGLAMTIDGNARYCRLDPFVGAQIAVAEAARNLVATGARPLALTDCLNLGNPERPEVAWQLEQVIEGIATACRAFQLPVVSGNVSLYNESPQGAIDPTVVVGMVGLLKDHRRRIPAGFQEPGDVVLLVGQTARELGGSEYLKVIHGVVHGPPPSLDLARERAAQSLVLEAAAEGLLRSAHDVAEGGLLVALVECCLLGGLGCQGRLVAPDDLGLDALLFGESQGRFLLSAHPRALPRLQALAARHTIELTVLGTVGGEVLRLEGLVEVPLAEARRAWEGALHD